MQARTLLVDYGEVVSETQPPETLEAMAGLVGLPLPSFVERYWEHRLPYDRGGSAREPGVSEVLVQLLTFLMQERGYHIEDGTSNAPVADEPPLNSDASPAIR